MHKINIVSFPPCSTPQGLAALSSSTSPTLDLRGHDKGLSVSPFLPSSIPPSLPPSLSLVPLRASPPSPLLPAPLLT